MAELTATELLEVEDWLDVTDNLAEMPIRIHGWDKDRGQYICEWYYDSWVIRNAGAPDYCYVKPTKYRPCPPNPAETKDNLDALYVGSMNDLNKRRFLEEPDQ